MLQSATLPLALIRLMLTLITLYFADVLIRHATMMLLPPPLRRGAASWLSRRDVATPRRLLSC